MKSLLVLGALVGASVLATSVVRAETDTMTTTSSSTVWRKAQPTYEFKHPMTVTCREFLDTEQIYRPYVVAWLSGRMIGVLDVGDPDDFVPVSVPATVTLCEEEPDMMVWELVQTQ